MCAVTWEPAGNVPDAIIEEFERGTVMEVTDQVTVTGIGQEVHTLTAIPNCTKTPVLPPTPSNARPVIKENEG